MEDVRSFVEKLVCRVDKCRKAVEIINKGYKTTILFLNDGTVKIINTDKPA